MSNDKDVDVFVNGQKCEYFSDDIMRSKPSKTERICDGISENVGLASLCCQTGEDVSKLVSTLTGNLIGILNRVENKNEIIDTVIRHLESEKDV